VISIEALIFIKNQQNLEGTEFQLQVWNVLRTIPFGSTVTYSQLASMIGKPNAVRTVANACASNPEENSS